LGTQKYRGDIGRPWLGKGFTNGSSESRPEVVEKLMIVEPRIMARLGDKLCATPERDPCF
jgi:hypothetical protein